MRNGCPCFRKDQATYRSSVVTSSAPRLLATRDGFAVWVSSLVVRSRSCDGYFLHVHFLFSRAFAVYFGNGFDRMTTARTLGLSETDHNRLTTDHCRPVWRMNSSLTSCVTAHKCRDSALHRQLHSLRSRPSSDPCFRRSLWALLGQLIFRLRSRVNYRVSWLTLSVLEACTNPARCAAVDKSAMPSRHFSRCLISCNLDVIPYAPPPQSPASATPPCRPETAELTARPMYSAMSARRHQSSAPATWRPTRWRVG